MVQQFRYYHDFSMLLSFWRSSRLSCINRRTRVLFGICTFLKSVFITRLVFFFLFWRLTSCRRKTSYRRRIVRDKSWSLDRARINIRRMLFFSSRNAPVIFLRAKNLAAYYFCIYDRLTHTSAKSGIQNALWPDTCFSSQNSFSFLPPDFLFIRSLTLDRASPSFDCQCFSCFKLVRRVFKIIRITNH